MYSEGEDDPALDFLSPSFDPLKALRASPTLVALPHPTVQPCDNLQTYSSVMQGTRRAPKLAPVLESSPAVRTPPEGTKKKKIRTVLDFMERSNPGPFSLLQQCRRERRYVRVLIRHCTGLRGVCEGIPVAYDRHMNMALQDVTEWCTPFRTVANGGLAPSKSQRRREKRREQDSEQAERTSVGVMGASNGHLVGTVSQRVKQLFVRGDNVVLVTKQPKLA